MRHPVLIYAVRGLERLAGRTRLAKFARLVTNEVRLDGANDMSSNGESLIQRTALSVESPMVLDVGAHFGEWSQSLLDQLGNAPTIHAFEPSAETAAKAIANLSGRATVHHLALSDRIGEATLQIVHAGAGSNSMVPFTDRSRRMGQTENITLSTVDVFAEANDIEHITLLKIDAEGHDLAVIRGARSMLQGHRVELVQFEYNHRWIDSRVFLLDAFEELQASGYRVGKVTRRGVEIYEEWRSELETFREGNYLGYLPSWESRLPTLPWWDDLPTLPWWDE